MTDPRIGSTLDGRYQIVGALAAGGMGVVYRGERLGLGRNVAIKFLHAHMAADSAFLKRFAIEAKAMARLQHPHCAAVIDFGVDGQEPYVVMDLVAGESLRKLLDRGRVPAWRALGIMRQVLSGLAHAHAQGITHRDIKPDNIMVEATGSFGDQVRILDFGLAKLRENTSGLTTGFVVGTPSYMAPEQTLAQPVDERTDIYACGVVLFEMLAGTKPFRADEAVEVLRMHRETPPPRLADLAPDARLSDEIEGAMLQALAKDPSHRFASAAAFATALDHVPEAATRPGSAPPMVSPHTPAPALTGAAHAALGTAPTEWSHPQPGAAPPGARATGPHTTEHLGASQIEVVVSEATRARPAPTENLGASQLHAFAAALAEPHPTRPLPEAPAARPDTGYPITRSDTAPPMAGPDTRFSAMRPDTVTHGPGPRTGARMPFTEPAMEPPAHAPGRRKLWIGLGAGAALVALLVVVGLLGDDAPQAVVPDEPAPGTTGELVVEGEPASGEDDPGQQDEPSQQDEPGQQDEPDENAVAAAADPGAALDEATPGEPSGAAAGDGAATRDSARSGVKTANQVVPPSLAQAQALLDQGRTSQAIKLLEKLKSQHRDNAQFHYLLGRAYFGELWVRDGLEAFREAIALDPTYRSHRDLIESVAQGLGNDSQHYAVSRFLVNEIGRDARPALEKVINGNYREDVRERARRVLGQIK